MGRFSNFSLIYKIVKCYMFIRKLLILLLLLNILLNAKDAIKNNNIENGEIFISLKKNKSSVEILIEDNGGGIDDKEILKSIFDLYFTTKKESHGTELACI